jgi:tRNA (adenine-N(1)-)-methyltransferase non-catalytic subunit
LIGRPYYYTYEFLEKQPGQQHPRLRIVSPAELNAEAGLDDAEAADETAELDRPSVSNGLPEGHDLAVVDANAISKDNRLTIDHAGRQALTQADIEELKKSTDGKEIIEKILANHTGLDEKTAFSKAKYMLRKHKKYLKRFTVLPMDLSHLIDHLMDKEPSRIMEIREEALGLITAWSNAHYSGLDGLAAEAALPATGRGKWLAVDDTGGLVVAALAERMDILHVPERSTTDEATSINSSLPNAQPQDDGSLESDNPQEPLDSSIIHRDFPLPATTNTITLIHPAVQPNVSLLKYFGYDTSTPTSTPHPLHTHLLPLSWLQLLDPTSDTTYTPPPTVPDNVLTTWKSGKRGTYFKKLRRHARCAAIVDSTRNNGHPSFDGLVIATHLDLTSVFAHLIPLVRGGGQIVVYSATAEPLVKLVDLYSKERRAAYISHLLKNPSNTPNSIPPDPQDFPLDPRLLLNPHLQTSRVRSWQCLPGRTHPLMTSRGGAEGFVFTARRVIPLEGGVEARGNFTANKRRKVVEEEEVVIEAGTPEEEVVVKGEGDGMVL